MHSQTTANSCANNHNNDKKKIKQEIKSW